METAIIKKSNIITIGRIPSYSDIDSIYPESATDYYAFHQTSKRREAHDIYLIKNALLTVDYTRKYRFHFCIKDEYGQPVFKDRQQFIIEAQPDVIDIAGRVAFSDDRFTKFNVSHFMFDKLWRAKCFEQFEPCTYAFLDVNEYMNSALQSLQYHATKMQASAGKVVTYRIEELLLSSSTMDFRHPGNNFAPEIVDLLNLLDHNLGLPKQASGEELYFIDRRDARTRRVLNMNEVSDVLHDYGVSIIEPDKFTLMEQIQLFNKAKVVIGVHGAGLSNAWFCRAKNAMLLEILPPLCATADYWKLAMAKGQKYDGFIANDIEYNKPDYSKWKHRPSEFNRRDVTIDVAKFKCFLKKHLG